MKSLLIVLALVASISAVNVQIGEAYLTPNAANAGLWGIVTFYYNASTGNVDVFANITGIQSFPNSLHGMHVHTNGDISDPNGWATLGHWSLAGEVHACENETYRHSGDMGNWNVTNGAINEWKYNLSKLALSGANSIIGRAVVLHNSTDDCTNVTTNGNSGARIAQGVIGISNPGTGNNNTASGRPSAVSGTDTAICYLQPFDNSGVTGYAIINQTAGSNTPSIFVYLKGCNNTVRGIHIHQYGDIRNAAASGGHWNPLGDIHGMYGFPHHHAGDLGNVYYFADPTNSTAYFNQTENDSFDVIGSYGITGLTLIVHANRDNCSTPIGFSGSRLAGCVFGLTNLANTTYLTPVPTGVPTAYDAQTVIDCTNAFNTTGSVSTGVSITTGISTGTPTTGSGSAITTGTTGTTGEVSSSVMMTISSAIIIAIVAAFF